MIIRLLLDFYVSSLLTNSGINIRFFVSIPSFRNMMLASERSTYRVLALANYVSLTLFKNEYRVKTEYNISLLFLGIICLVSSSLAFGTQTYKYFLTIQVPTQKRRLR